MRSLRAIASSMVLVGVMVYTWAILIHMCATFTLVKIFRASLRRLSLLATALPNVRPTTNQSHLSTAYERGPGEKLFSMCGSPPGPHHCCRIDIVAPWDPTLTMSSRSRQFHNVWTKVCQKMDLRSTGSPVRMANGSRSDPTKCPGDLEFLCGPWRVI